MPTGVRHINKPLTNISIKYRNTEFIEADIFPSIPVDKESNTYFVHTADFRIPETERANGSPANQITWGLSTSTYSLKEHALKDIITDRDRKNYDAPISADAERTEILTDKLELRKEQQAAAIIFTTTTWSNNTTYTATATQSWKTSTVYPIKDILSATSVIRKSSAKSPNTMILGSDAFDTVKENANVYGRIQYVERALVSEKILAAIFDVDRVLVGRTIYDTNYEGLSESTAYLWGANCWLGYISPRPALRTPSALYRFDGQKRQVKKWRDEDRNGDWVEVSEIYRQKAPATACGYLIKSVNL